MTLLFSIKSEANTSFDRSVQKFHNAQNSIVSAPKDFDISLNSFEESLEEQEEETEDDDFQNKNRYSPLFKKGLKASVINASNQLFNSSLVFYSHVLNDLHTLNIRLNI